MTTIYELYELLEEKKESTVEFSRKNKVVFADDNFKLKEISYDKTKEFLNKAKKFLEISKKIVDKKLMNLY